MKLSDMFDKDAFFRPESDIKEWIKNSKNYEGEEPASAKLLMFFSTSKQRTYLVVTPKRLYCILDDIRKDNPHINWTMPKRKIKDNGDLKITISTRDKTDNTGIVDIGSKHKNWLYSKKLFSSSSIESCITEFIKSAM